MHYDNDRKDDRSGNVALCMKHKIGQVNKWL